MNYFLIPGNPPAVSFYELWSDEIKAEHLGAKVKVSAYPLLSFMADSSRAMDEVLAAHLKNLNEFHEEIGAPVTIIGHSLGGYFATRLLEQAHDRIFEVMLAYPFLRAPNLGGQMILNSVGAFHGHDRLQRAILRVRKYLERISPELEFVSDEEILKSFHLGRHESQTIARDRSPIVIRPELCDKIRVFYNRSDRWCPPQVVAKLEKQVAVFECSEPHGFVTDEKHRLSLFAKMRQSSRVL